MKNYILIIASNFELRIAHILLDVSKYFYLKRIKIISLSMITFSEIEKSLLLTILFFMKKFMKKFPYKVKHSISYINPY